MEINHVTLKPSLLIGSIISTVGASKTKCVVTGVERDALKETKTWEMRRIIPDTAQYKLANKAVEKCKKIRGKVCRKMAFGWVCPKDSEDKLTEGIKKIGEIIDEVNGKLNTCEVFATFVRAEIASDDKQVATSIAKDVNGFFKSLKAALDKADAKAIKRTVQSMKGLEDVLPTIQSEALSKAVKAATKAAKTIITQVEKKARSIEEVKAELDLTVIETARMAFIEAETPAAVVPQGEQLETRAAVEL